jgi:hypothetical protein
MGADINDIVASVIEQCPKILIVIDPLEVKQAIKANDMLSVLWDLDKHLNDLIRYNEDHTLSNAADKIRERFWELMNDAGISFEELYP